MKNPLLTGKAILVEMVGLLGGFFWAKSTGWDYEPLILFIVSFISLLGTVISHIINRFNSKEVDSAIKKTSSETIQDKVNKLDAKQIIKQVNSVAPYLESEMKNSYIGLEIQWSVSLHSLIRRDNNIYHIMTLYEGGYPWVYFDIDIEKYPMFRVARKNESFLIKGIINDVGANTFTINVLEIN